MKKFKSLVALAALAMCLPLVTSCGGSSGSEVEEAIKDAMTMTYEELVAKAKEEVGTDTVVTYGNSSAFSKAVTAFTEETGIAVRNEKKGDAETYTELGESFGANRYIADMVLLQDGNKLQSEMIANDFLENYIPNDEKSNIDNDDLDPTAAIYLNKVFMYNNTNYDGTNGATAQQGQLTNYLTNVWQLAGTSSDTGHISNLSFKTPSSENVNMNFLVMLTSPEWVTKLEQAYQSFYGTAYDGSADSYKNIGYKYIAEFMRNITRHSSDGTACKDVAKGNGGSMALVNLNKNKDLSETGGPGTMDPANLTYPARERENNLVGFGGFCYKMYAMVASNAKYPYAACALINYIVSAEGFGQAWGALDGYYSTNKTAPIAETDKELSWWKERLVIEDPAYVASNYTDVFSFVQQYES